MVTFLSFLLYVYSLICLQFGSRTAARSPATDAVPLRKASTVAAWTSLQPMPAHNTRLLQLNRKIKNKSVGSSLLIQNWLQLTYASWIELVGSNSGTFLAPCTWVVITQPSPCINESTDYFTAHYDCSADRVLNKSSKPKKSTLTCNSMQHWSVCHCVGFYRGYQEVSHWVSWFKKFTSPQLAAPSLYPKCNTRVHLSPTTLPRN